MNNECEILEADVEEATALGRRLAGKYMTFKLANEEYGLEILKVRELIGPMNITRIPCMPEFLSGVINLRGKLITVLDLRLKLRMEGCQLTRQTVIVVVQHNRHGRNMTMGLLVDQVLEVISIEAKHIELPPEFGSRPLRNDYISGIGKAEERVIFLLDIGKVLHPEQSGTVAKVTKAS